MNKWFCKTLGINLLVLTTSFSFAQTDTLHLYYNINESIIARHQHKLDSACNANKSLIKAVQVIGHADYLGNTQYNFELSTARAINAGKYLHQLLPQASIDHIGKGEIQLKGAANPNGVPADRRVDIIYERIPKQVTIQPKSDTIVKVVPPKMPFRDTVFEAKLDSLALLKPGERIDINELLFLAGRHYLTPASYKYANILVEILKKHPKLKIKLIGHICCQYDGRDGYDYDNKKWHLSASRAEFLYEYLAKAGIDKSRMSHKGVGSSDQKVFPEVTPEDSDLNRRVEIVVMSNKE